MTGELAGGIRRGGFRHGTGRGLAANDLHHVPELFPGDGTFSEQFQGRLSLVVHYGPHDSTFQPFGTGPGIQDHFNAAAQLLFHRGGGSRADVAKPVGAGRRYRPSQSLGHSAHRRMSAYPHGYRRQSAGDDVRNDVSLRQNHGQRPRPEFGCQGVHQFPKLFGNIRVFLNFFPMMHMNDERVEEGRPLTSKILATASGFRASAPGRKRFPWESPPEHPPPALPAARTYSLRLSDRDPPRICRFA